MAHKKNQELGGQWVRYWKWAWYWRN